MNNIDYIIDMLDWNKSPEIQTKGRELARSVSSINVFIQPLHKDHNKNIWDNCAKILAERDDDELTPYLIPLLEWLQDMNWPGAFCIYERVKLYSDSSSFTAAFNICLKKAQLLNDEIWMRNLLELKSERT